MPWLIETLTSTIGKKLIMSLTGLFLVVFLLVHLIGNLQLLSDDGGAAFNVYAQFMTTNPIIKTTSYGLYSFIILHAVLSLGLTMSNRKARGGQGYSRSSSKSSTWSSRNMGVLGTLILIFIVVSILFTLDNNFLSLLLVILNHKHISIIIYGYCHMDPLV